MGHQFLVAAYCCTWGIQLAYLAWIILRWFRQAEQLRSENRRLR